MRIMYLNEQKKQQHQGPQVPSSTSMAVKMTKLQPYAQLWLADFLCSVRRVCLVRNRRAFKQLLVFLCSLADGARFTASFSSAVVESELMYSVRVAGLNKCMGMMCRVVIW